MRLLIIFLALFCLNYSNSHAIDNVTFKANKASFNQSKRLTFGDVPDIDRFINATIALQIKEKVYIEEGVEERAKDCMGIIIDNQKIYTALHCLYSSNNANKDVVIEVFDPSRTHHLATIQYKLEVNNAFYETNTIRYNQTDFLSIPLETPLNRDGNALITKNDIIDKGIPLTALLTCHPAFVNLNVLDKNIEKACKIRPTDIIVLQDTQNGGGYAIKQESSLFFKHKDSSESRNFGYSPSFGIADHFTYPTKSLADMEIITFKQFSSTFGAFHYYNPQTKSTRYSYENALANDPKWSSSLKYLLIDNHPQAKHGDSGGPVIACDNAKILRKDRQANCYLTGLVVSSPHDHGQAIADFIRGFVTKP